MEEPEFIQITGLQIKGIESFSAIGNQIKKHIIKDLKEKDILYQREYRILFMSSYDENIEKFIFWITDHFRIPGIQIRVFYRKEPVFNEPYIDYDKDGILMTLSETIASVVSRNRHMYDTFFFVTTHSIPAKHTDDIWLILQEKIRQDVAHHKLLLNSGQQKIPSKK